MIKSNAKRPVGLYPIIAWTAILATFMILELTVFNDSADLNNSILLALSALSIIGLFSMRKIGAALATFTLIYAFSFNAFNVIYFPNTAILNSTSAILNAAAALYMFRTIFSNKFN